MSINQKNRAVVANSSKWVRLSAFWKVLVDYTNDYVSGNKYKYISDLNNSKQK